MSYHGISSLCSFFICVCSNYSFVVVLMFIIWSNPWCSCDFFRGGWYSCNLLDFYFCLIIFLSVSCLKSVTVHIDKTASHVPSEGIIRYTLSTWSCSPLIQLLTSAKVTRSFYWYCSVDRQSLSFVGEMLSMASATVLGGCWRVWRLV